MSAPRVAVVLGGGGAKAAAHLGGAIALRAAGIRPVHWVGTSMGSVIAAAMAGGADPVALLAEFTQVRNSDVLERERFALLKGIWAPAIFRSDTFRATLERLSLRDGLPICIRPAPLPQSNATRDKWCPSGRGGRMPRCSMCWRRRARCHPGSGP